MAEIEKNIQYMEGEWVGTHSIGPNVDKTHYKTLDKAIEVKELVVQHFETEFGYSREMELPDKNYAYELGILEGLKKLRDGERSTPRND
jgi:hypothetical protein